MNYYELDAPYIDQLGRVVKRIETRHLGGVVCASCLYGDHVYREQYNNDVKAGDVCKKYRPVVDTEVGVCPYGGANVLGYTQKMRIFVEVKHD